MFPSAKGDQWQAKMQGTGRAFSSCVNLVTARQREAQLAVGRAQASGRRLAQRERNWLVPLGRCGYAVAAFTYAGLAFSAVAMLTRGVAQPNEDQSAQDRTAWLLSQPFGSWLVGLAGLVVVGVALNQFVLAWRGTLDRELQTRDLDPQLRQVVSAAARLGNTARGVAFGLIGAFLFSPACRPARTRRVVWVEHSTVSPSNHSDAGSQGWSASD